MCDNHKNNALFETELSIYLEIIFKKSDLNYETIVMEGELK